MSSADAPRILGPDDGSAGRLGSIGVRFMIDGEDSGGGFALVEHPMPPRALAAPLHRHGREGEYSYVLQGRVGALLGDDVVFGEPGDLIFKPRGQWHTFWNAGDTPARILEVISPAGFEGYFRELVELLEQGVPPAPERAALANRYDLDIDLQSPAAPDRRSRGPLRRRGRRHPRLVPRVIPQNQVPLPGTDTEPVQVDELRPVLSTITLPTRASPCRTTSAHGTPPLEVGSKILQATSHARPRV